MAAFLRFKLTEPVIINGWPVVYGVPVLQDDEEPLWGTPLEAAIEAIFLSKSAPAANASSSVPEAVPEKQKARN